MIEEKPTEHKCPNCGKAMMLRHGRFGSFLGCSAYPECKTVLKTDKDGNVLPPKAPPEPTGLKCYKCKTGQLVIRQSKKGPFLGCDKFPKCKTIVSMKHHDLLKQLAAAGKWPPETVEQAKELLGNGDDRKVKKSGKKTAANDDY